LKSKDIVNRIVEGYLRSQNAEAIKNYGLITLAIIEKERATEGIVQ
jgi:hypothetical protein